MAASVLLCGLLCANARLALSTWLLLSHSYKCMTSMKRLLSMQAMAASLLLRGLLFASVNQAPRRWLPLRKSAWGTAQQGVGANLAQLRGLVWARTGSA